MSFSGAERESQQERLEQAVTLVKANQREVAVRLLRDLIREDNDFEAAWLWMSVAVEKLDQSALCLENVLRINPNNALAAGALYSLRESEMLMSQRRSRYRTLRDSAFIFMWVLILVLLIGVWITVSNELSAAIDTSTLTPQIGPLLPTP